MTKPLKKFLTFGFEQTFTIENWWTDEGFTATSDTPLKRAKMLALAECLAQALEGKFFSSQDIWGHLQYEVADATGETQFFVTMDPGSIEVKTPPCLCDQVEQMAEPLFQAAKKAEVVPYRNWWYGIKGGTEGGCHVNMGGRDHASNPLIEHPDLVVQYAAYMHNRPFLHYPFMGLDVGPGGNAMRMDEKQGFEEVKAKFAAYKMASMRAEEIHPYFAQTNLITEKGSFPSLYKFKSGLFLIEDRGQEALREPEDFYLVSLIRLKILEQLSQTKKLEPLETFPHLHLDYLTSFYLWNQFKSWSVSMGLPTEKYRRFFERQFPRLTGGENSPSVIQLIEGKRPRVITDIKKRGDVVISKNIDTRYKRFEIFCTQAVTDIKIETTSEIEFQSDLKHTEDGCYRYIDLKYYKENPQLIIEIINQNESVERAVFNIHNMMWE